MSEKKRGLGRGLSALLPREEAVAGVRELPIGQLQPNRLQPRSQFDDEGLEELAASIRAQGILQPIVVNQLGANTYAIIAGERRWRAAQRAGLVTVPVVLRDVRDDQHRLELALVENVQRADLNAVEEADAYRLLAEKFSLTHDQIAERVGKSRVAVTNALRLLRLPEAVLDLLRAGQLTAGQARPLLALADPEAALRLAERAVRQGLPARAIEAMVSPNDSKRRVAPEAEPHAAAAADKLTRLLQTKVEIDRRGKGGALRIRFHSEEELMRLYDLLVKAASRA